MSLCASRSQMPCTERSISPLAPSIRETHKSRTPAGSFSLSTDSALLVALVTSTCCPCDKKCPNKLAIVWVLPVPGGPCTTTAGDEAILRAIPSCSALAALVSKISSASPRISDRFIVNGSASSCGVSGSTMRKSASGTSPACSILAIIAAMERSVPGCTRRRKST